MNYLEIFFWLMVTTVSGSAGALYLKKAMNDMPSLSVQAIATSLSFWIGAILYILSAVTNIVLFKFLDYSIAFPMTSLTYVWTIIISYFVFKEKITPRKIMAIAIIIAGVTCLGLA